MMRFLTLSRIIMKLSGAHIGINLPSHSVAKNLFDSFLFQEKLNFKVKATGIVLKKLYFQCVMLKIEESKELMDLNMACQLHFTDKMEPYWPHLSLVYGTFTEKKQLQLKEEIERKYKTVLELEEKIFAAELWMTPDDVSSWEKNCTSYAKA
ncbi:hypothetical protein HDU92_007025 [Lobulomyces angularis]|nr:hypothetical protein HDU92_007025 [Lobulomyces angularis]